MADETRSGRAAVRIAQTKWDGRRERVSRWGLGPFLLASLLLWTGASASAEPPRRDLDEAEERRVDEWVAAHLESLLAVYRDLHARPELSLEEKETAAFVADFLEDEAYRVETGIGGHGVIGVLRNGQGPTLLVRGDMDGLPVVEETGLAYASRVTVRQSEGVVVGTMHACGHDMHVANLLGTARLLASLRAHWRGTLVILAQPAEEIGVGASMMIEDGLFDRIPRPDHALALHVSDELPAGSIGSVSGWAAANVDSIDVTIFGRGGHGARPHQTVDPIVISAQLVTALQTLVSRRVDPTEAAVVTVGSIHGGTKHNVIPDEVVLQLTVRSYREGVRRVLLDGIAELARGTCEALGCAKPPEIRVKEDYTPAMYNDPDLAGHAVELFEDLLGTEKVSSIRATMTGEDFGQYSRQGGFPGFLYRLGSVNEERWRASRGEGGEPLPSLHSSRFAPDAAPTLETGMRSMARLALSLLAAP